MSLSRRIINKTDRDPLFIRVTIVGFCLFLKIPSDVATMVECTAHTYGVYYEDTKMDNSQRNSMLLIPSLVSLIG